MAASDAAEEYHVRMMDVVAAKHGYPLNPVPEEIRQKVTVNKQTHRIRYENETESSVDVVIEPKQEQQ